jgi:anti-anti-sigma factor
MASAGGAGKCGCSMDVFAGRREAPPPEAETARIRLVSVGGPPTEVTVHVSGEIDLFTEPALTCCLTEQLQTTPDLSSLVVDLSSVTFVGARGLSALLSVAHNATCRGIAFRVAGCSRQVLRCLDIIDPHETLPRQAACGTAEGGRHRADRETRPRSGGGVRQRTVFVPAQTRRPEAWGS